MRKVLCIACCFVLTFSLAFASGKGEKKAILHYLPDVPVYLHSEVSLDISQTLPGLSLATRGKQAIDALISVTSDQPGLPISQPPFSVTFVLKGLKIDLRANDESITFDSSQQGSSLFLSQVSKMIDRPIRIRVGDEFRLEGDSDELRQIIKELPVLQEIQPETLLAELFMHQFALGGEELFEGKTITRDLGDYDIPSLPTAVKYTITKVDDYNVYATIGGEIEERKFNLKGLVQIDEKHEEVVSVRLSGAVTGSLKCNRDNAMLYDLDMEYAYSAKFQLGEWEWVMHVKLDSHNRTRLRAG